MREVLRYVMFWTVFLWVGCGRIGYKDVKNGTDASVLLDLSDIPDGAKGGIIYGKGSCGWVKLELESDQLEDFLSKNGILKDADFGNRDRVIGRLLEINNQQGEVFFPPETKLKRWIDGRHYTVGIEEVSRDRVRLYLIVYRD